MRFRRRGSFRSALPREPRFWRRRLTSSGVLQDTLAATRDIVLFDPAADLASTQDARVTLMKLIVDISSAFVFAGGTGAVGDVYALAAGIYMRGVGEPARNPLQAGAADQSADWLWLDYRPFQMSVYPAIVTPNYEVNLLSQFARIDIRAMRKLTEDQVIALAFRADGTEVLQTGHSPATVNFSSRVLVSALWQRTLRKRS